MSAARRRDKEATRAEILDAAEDLFARKGFAATSLTEIAGQAQVTKSLIHHHFGSKSQLWHEIKKGHFAEYQQLQAGLLAAPEMDPKILSQSIDAYFAFLHSRPRLARMLGWMGLEEMDETAGELPGMDLVRLGVEKLTLAQENGMIRKDLNPLHIILIYLFAVEHWNICGPLLCPIIGAEVDEAAGQEFLRNVKEIMLQGILATGPEAADE